ncbi:MAG TPA: DUF1189 family protein, partial [Bacilli bacterium]
RRAVNDLNFLKRFSNSLFAPKEVINYKNDPWWITLLYFFTLVLFLIIPQTISVLQTDILNYEVKKELRSHFNGQEDIPFTIVNGVLVHDTNDTDYVYQHKFNNINIVFTTTMDNIDDNLTDILTIIFQSDGVYIKQVLITRKVFQYDDYPILNGIDFSDASSHQNHEFWDKIFTVASQEINKIRPIINVVNVIVNGVVLILDLLIFCIVFSLFQTLLVSRVIKYTKLFKLSIYLLLPYTLGNVLSILFGYNIIYYLGLLISAIYITILSRTIIRDAMKRG